MRLTLLTIAFVSIMSLSFSQERKILGRIVDQTTNKPVKGAEVVIEGTQIFTTTNFVGAFELAVNYSKHEKLKITKPGYVSLVIKIPKSEKFAFAITRDYFPLQQINLSEYPKNIENVPVLITKDEITVNILRQFASPPEGFPRFNCYLANAIVDFDTKERLNPSTVNFSIDTTGKAIDIVIAGDSTGKIVAPIIKALQNMPAWTTVVVDGKKSISNFSIRVLPKRAEVLENFYLKMQKEIWDKSPTGKGYMDVTFRVAADGRINDLTVIHDLKTISKKVTEVIRSIPASEAKAIAEATGTDLFLFSTDINVTPQRTDRPQIAGAYSFPVLEIVREVQYGRVKLGTGTTPMNAIPIR